jgi:Glutamine amidotransferase class-I
MEIVELSDHPFFVGTQFHPEFKSRPRKPSPPFLGLCLAASSRLSSYFSGAALRCASRGTTYMKLVLCCALRTVSLLWLK